MRKLRIPYIPQGCDQQSRYRAGRPSVLPTLEVPQIRRPSRLRLALRRAYRNFAALVLRVF